MKRKDILELKKRFKKDECTFTRICGCFVNSEKNIVLEINENFLNLDEDDYFKYLEIAKKVLSGTIGNNILGLNFVNDEKELNDKQLSLIGLKKSKLKDNDLLDNLYKSIIDNYNYEGNYLILLFHDVYDIITKTKDNLKVDESEEVFEYIICAICPISLSDAGLSYCEEENKIKSRVRDWVVGFPTSGFTYPAFIDRSPDTDSIMYYTKNPKEIHEELLENTLGCLAKDTSTIQKNKFQSVIKDSISADEEEANKTYMEVQENLSNMVSDYKLHTNNENSEPIKLTQDNLKDILEESGITKDNVLKIENLYKENFDNDIPLAESLIDKKALKESELRKKERNLEKQVEFLKVKLEQVDFKENIEKNYDIILQVKPEKVSEIKSQTIDGQECIIIPVSRNEKTTIHELR